MALLDQNDPTATDHRHMRPIDRTTGLWDGTALPLLVAIAIAIALIAMFYPSGDGRVGDTNNAGSPVQTVTPSPSPSTSPTVPTPTPTTEPRPTQAPIR